MTTTPTVGRIPVPGGGWGKRKAKIPGMTTFHRGVDIAAPVGTDVVAPLAGVVTASTYNLIRGHYVVIDHGGGWSTSSQHLSTRLAKVGDRVAEGQRVGMSGRTGNVTGPHNHTEVRWQGTPVDPDPWYRARGVELGRESAPVLVLPTYTTTSEEDDMTPFIIECYRVLFGREPDLEGLASWTDRARREGLTAAGLIDAFRAVPATAEPGSVSAAYRRYLPTHRDASPAEQREQLARGYTVGALHDAVKAAAAAGAR